MKKKSFMSPNDSTPVIVLKIAFGVLFVVPLLFWPAGTLDWPEGWLLTIILFFYALGTSLYAKKHNPELFENRTAMELPPKLWDKIIMGFVALLFVSLYVVAPLDAVRYGFSVVPMWLKAFGFLGFAFSLAAFFLIMKENATLFTSVKVKKGQKVVSTGPYGIIRHPLYAAAILMIVSTPLALGSYYGLVPAALLVAAMILRTKLEDKELHKELPGYAEYAEKTRYRLLPGVW